MSDNITIVVYEAVDDVPENRRFLAQMFTVGQTKPKEGEEPKEALTFLPIHFCAATEEKVTEAAQAWFDEHSAKERRRKEMALAAAARSPRSKKEPTDAP